MERFGKNFVSFAEGHRVIVEHFEVVTEKASFCLNTFGRQTNQIKSGSFFFLAGKERRKFSESYQGSADHSMACQVFGGRSIREPGSFEKPQVLGSEKPLNNMLPKYFARRRFRSEFLSVKLKDVTASAASKAGRYFDWVRGCHHG
jgi:hypothetical protein